MKLMNRSTALLAGGIACLTAGLAACADGTAPTAVSELDDQTFSAGPPPTSGSPNGEAIVRFENVSFFITEDLDDGLVAFHPAAPAKAQREQMKIRRLILEQSPDAARRQAIPVTDSQMPRPLVVEYY
jgi:hypothetical protein